MQKVAHAFLRGAGSVLTQTTGAFASPVALFKRGRDSFQAVLHNAIGNKTSVDAQSPGKLQSLADVTVKMQPTVKAAPRAATVIETHLQTIDRTHQFDGNNGTSPTMPGAQLRSLLRFVFPGNYENANDLESARKSATCEKANTKAVHVPAKHVERKETPSDRIADTEIVGSSSSVTLGPQQLPHVQSNVAVEQAQIAKKTQLSGNKDLQLKSESVPSVGIDRLTSVSTLNTEEQGGHRVAKVQASPLKDNRSIATEKVSTSLSMTDRAAYSPQKTTSPQPAISGHSNDPIVQTSNKTEPRPATVPTVSLTKSNSSVTGEQQSLIRGDATTRAEFDLRSDRPGALSTNRADALEISIADQPKLAEGTKMRSFGAGRHESSIRSRIESFWSNKVDQALQPDSLTSRLQSIGVVRTAVNRIFSMLPREHTARHVKVEPAPSFRETPKTTVASQSTHPSLMATEVEVSPYSKMRSAHHRQAERSIANNSSTPELSSKHLTEVTKPVAQSLRDAEKISTLPVETSNKSALHVIREIVGQFLPSTPHQRTGYTGKTISAERNSIKPGAAADLARTLDLTAATKTEASLQLMSRTVQERQADQIGVNKTFPTDPAATVSPQVTRPAMPIVVESSALGANSSREVAGESQSATVTPLKTPQLLSRIWKSSRSKVADENLSRTLQSAEPQRREQSVTPKEGQQARISSSDVSIAKGDLKSEAIKPHIEKPGAKALYSEVIGSDLHRAIRSEINPVRNETHKLDLVKSSKKILNSFISRVAEKLIADFRPEINPAARKLASNSRDSKPAAVSQQMPHEPGIAKRPPLSVAIELKSSEEYIKGTAESNDVSRAIHQQDALSAGADTSVPHKAEMARVHKSDIAFTTHGSNESLDRNRVNTDEQSPLFRNIKPQELLGERSSDEAVLDKNRTISGELTLFDKNKRPQTEMGKHTLVDHVQPESGHVLIEGATKFEQPMREAANLRVQPMGIDNHNRSIPNEKWPAVESTVMKSDFRPDATRTARADERIQSRSDMLSMQSPTTVQRVTERSTSTDDGQLPRDQERPARQSEAANLQKPSGQSGVDNAVQPTEKAATSIQNSPIRELIAEHKVRSFPQLNSMREMATVIFERIRMTPEQIPVMKFDWTHEELGELQFVIRSRRDEVHVNIVAPTEQAAETINSGRISLQAIFLESGLRLEKFDATAVQSNHWADRDEKRRSQSRSAADSELENQSGNHEHASNNRERLANIDTDASQNRGRAGWIA